MKMPVVPIRAWPSVIALALTVNPDTPRTDAKSLALLLVIHAYNSAANVAKDIFFDTPVEVLRMMISILLVVSDDNPLSRESNVVVVTAIIL